MSTSINKLFGRSGENYNAFFVESHRIILFIEQLYGQHEIQ